MCGICGKLIFKDERVDQSLLKAMCDTLTHRGPDDVGYYTSAHIGLGQRRLSIIDLSPEAAAPLCNEDGTIWLVCNGEVYNFHELRENLVEKGHTFRTGTDIEVIIHLYEEYGAECLDKMRGMFAFAVWDESKNILFAARDRLGKKPLCYCRTAGSLVFGSEIKAITKDPQVSVSPNLYAIDSYLTYQYVPSPVTAFEGINKLPPGHYLTCTTDGQLNVHQYWAAPLAEKTDMPREEIAERLIDMLSESVRLRMISDVPLGAFLSGGIDSGLVVALMAQNSSRPVKTFSIGFTEDRFNELPFARLVAERYGTEHQEFTLEQDAAEVLPLLVRQYNEPFADSSALPTYYVSKMTRQHVTVALSGDGGDENFSGYGRYGRVRRWNGFDRIPLPLKKIAKGLRLGSEKLPYNNRLARVSRGLAMLEGNLRNRYLLATSMLKSQEKREIYSADFKRFLAAGPNGTADRPANYPWASDMDELDWMMRHDISFYLPDCLMVKTDIASMTNSLEVRCPLLDHHFVEFAASIPADLKRNGTEGKVILKKAAEQLLPSEIRSKRKTGFAIPLAKWLREDLLDTLRGTLADDRAAKRGLFNRGVVLKMMDEHCREVRDWSNRLWALLFLELWFREFID